MDLEIRHDRGAHRFETEVDGHHGKLDYQLADGVMVITHTGVPAAVGGRGIAAQLVRRAFDTAREEGWKVRAACSYAQAYAERHPELAALLV